MPLHTYVPCWGVLKMYFKINTGNQESHDVKIEPKDIVFWIVMKMHISLHIYKQKEFEFY